MISVATAIAAIVSRNTPIPSILASRARAV